MIDINKIRKTWDKIYNENNVLVYEGFTYNGKPCGSGTVFFEDSSIYQEGTFAVKGLLSGREYYRNGVLRFEGDCFLNPNYGPNFPRNGKYYNSEGNLVYSGKFYWKCGGVGYPVACISADYGRVRQADAPSFLVLTWKDL